MPTLPSTCPRPLTPHLHTLSIIVTYHFAFGLGISMTLNAYIFWTATNQNVIPHSRQVPSWRIEWATFGFTPSRPPCWTPYIPYIPTPSSLHTHLYLHKFLPIHNVIYLQYLSTMSCPIHILVHRPTYITILHAHTPYLHTQWATNHLHTHQSLIPISLCSVLVSILLETLISFERLLNQNVILQ